MFNFRIAISPSGIPHIGNFFIILINYILKNKLFGNIILRFDNTNQKKNKNINKIFIIKFLKKIGIFLKKEKNQLNYFYLYIFFLFKIKKKKISFKKEYFNLKIIKKNINYSFFLLIYFCKIKFLDNNFGNFYFFFFSKKIILLKSNGIITYNYSSIINDYFYNIFIILRGKEWLNQIPFQLILNKIFNKKLFFHHIPNINNNYGKKISKRNFLYNFNLFDIFKIFNFYYKKIFNILKFNFFFKKDIKIFFNKKKNIFYNNINKYIYYFFLLFKIKFCFNIKNNVNFKNILNYNNLLKLFLEEKNFFFYKKIKKIIFFYEFI
ncbi:putative glutamyl-tRNA synthetase [Candidatus Carsonella ruddii CS isolate Thao2000]|uniref:Putative glutamyl-tRNA synthetase n=1 Tax=Candidatus Carsonella ruddii CS isolate Thao2000 TaxID=1202537 RepID=J7GSP7_CARRU|nr:glutamate--tRNA ligase family protein [Candidatus Carsonella ruddii]AFP83777.1 putative glutamyl-tRNA synthetase [Candidatus Carsonella ruddii CS isolate Thao2000]